MAAIVPIFAERLLQLSFRNALSASSLSRFFSMEKEYLDFFYFREQNLSEIRVEQI